MSVRTRIGLISLLSFYIDFVFVNAIVRLVSFLVGRSFGYVSGEGMAYAAEIGVSIVMVGLGRALGLSAGKPLLSYATAEAASGVRRRLWANLLLGTLLVLDGLKQMTRWTQLDAVLPVFGLLDTTPLKIVLLLALGLLSVAGGCLLLAFEARAKLVAAASLILSAISLALSWRVMPEGIERAQVARREMQNLPIREGEIEFMQAMIQYASIVFLVLLLGILYLCRTRDAARA